MAAADTATDNVWQSEIDFLTTTDPSDMIMAWSGLDIFAPNLSPPRAVLSNVTGFVKRGGITAVIGASSSGKSVLLKTLAGRASELAPLQIHAKRSTLLGRPVDLSKASSSQLPTVYVPQNDDGLIGVLTTREALTYAAKFKQPKHQDHDALVERTLRRIGLQDNADTAIGTFFKRGLSGGQKRRCSLGLELVSEPVVMCLDEPTSGLDTTRAISVIAALRDLLNASPTDMGIILSIHQPNEELVAHFDHLLVLSEGGPAFFGTPKQAETYFAQMGYPVPPDDVLTDHVLMMAAGLGPNPDLDLVSRFANSKLHMATTAAVEAASRRRYRAEAPAPAADDRRNGGPSRGKGEGAPRRKSMGGGAVAPWHQARKGFFSFSDYCQLVKRFFVIARRDLTLFYLQAVLQGVYGVLMGATFYQLPAVINEDINQLFSACLWLIGIATMIHVFSVFFQTASWNILQHEKANGSYSATSYYLAETTLAVLMNWMFLLGPIIAFFLVDLPAENFGYFVAVAFVGSFVGISYAHLVVQFTTPNPALAVLAFQFLILVIFPFSGGIFIRDDQIPLFWGRWLPHISAFQHGVDALIAGLWGNIDYTCEAELNTNNATCVFSGVTFDCDVAFNGTAGTCIVSGREVVAKYKGINPDKTDSLIYLLLIGLVCRALTYFFYLYPVKGILGSLKRWMRSQASKSIMEITSEQTRLRRVVDALQQEAGVSSASSASLALSGPTASAAARAASAPETTSKSSSSAPHGGRDLVFRNVWVYLSKKKAKKVLLHDISGCARAGRVCALMGPSGAGKTTLLNALAARAPYAQVDSEVVLGDVIFTKRHLAYVPQFDTIPLDFTPSELLLYTSNLAVKEHPDDKAVEVESLLEILGLSEVADKRCEHLTGGQLKRVSIGLGLVAQPQVLFLDEPTTGLDSSAAYTIMDYLSRVTKELGITTITTLHQPSRAVFNNIDDLLLLSPGGRLAFAGPVHKARPYFESLGVQFPTQANVADTVLDLVSDTPAAAGVHGNDITWPELFAASGGNVIPARRQYRLEKEQAALSSWSRYTLLTRHLLVHYWRTPAIYGYRALLLFVMALFLGTLFFDTPERLDAMQDVAGALFYALWVVSFLTISNAGTLVFERNVMANAYASDHYGLITWTMAQLTASLPFALISSFIFQIPFHFLVGLTDSTTSFFHSYFMNIVLFIFTEAVVWNVVEMTRNSQLAVTGATTVMGSFYLYSSFFIRQEAMPPAVSWVPFLMPTKYLLTGSLYSVISSNDYLDPATGNEVTGETVLSEVFNLSDEKPWPLLLVGLAFAALFRIQHVGSMYMHLHKLGKGTTAAAGSQSGNADTSKPDHTASRTSPSTSTATSAFPLASTNGREMSPVDHMYSRKTALTDV